MLCCVDASQNAKVPPKSVEPPPATVSHKIVFRHVSRSIFKTAAVSLFSLDKSHASF